MKNTVITGLQHIGIPTSRFDDTLTFFKDVGFEVIYEVSLEDGIKRVAFLQLNDVMLEVYEGETAGRAGAIEHFALAVTDIQSVYVLMLGKGYEVIEKEICSLPFFENGVQFFTIEGPNKEKIEFCQRG